jgi:hypothetical protein
MFYLCAAFKAGIGVIFHLVKWPRILIFVYFHTILIIKSVIEKYNILIFDNIRSYISDEFI